MTPDERIAELDEVVAQQHAVLAQQREQITVLLAEIQDPRGRLAKDTYTTAIILRSLRQQLGRRSLRRPARQPEITVLPSVV